MEKSESNLAFINITHADPMQLFREWREEAKVHNDNSLLSVMCLATVSQEGVVSARNVLVLKMDGDGFVFLTDRRSNKSKDIEYNSNVASTFLWHYVKDGDQITRQVRIQGILHEIDQVVCEGIYNEIPLFAKIRSYICHQDQEVDWGELKSIHDKVLKDVISSDAKLPMPVHELCHDFEQGGVLHPDFERPKINKLLLNLV